MVYYNLEGLYLAKVTFANGSIIDEHTRNPCGDPNSGGGGDGGDPGDGGGSGTGGGGIGTGSSPCSWTHEWIEIGCICEPGDTLGCPGPTVVAVIHIVCPDRSLFREPCCFPPCDTPPECHHPNGDPCPCDVNGTDCAVENPHIIINIETPDCQQLMKISDHLETRNKINQLKNELNSGIEKGFEIEMNNGEISNSTPIRDGNANEFIFDFVNLNPVVGVHTHHNGLFPLFSHEDILDLFEFFGNNTGSTSIPTQILVNTLGVHAIKIDNISQFAAFYTQAVTDPAYFENLRRTIGRKYLATNPIQNGIPTGTMIANERAFLELINDFDMGISLYRANPGVTGWVRLNLNENNNIVWTDVCNY